jgi:hypothetical protein
MPDEVVVDDRRAVIEAAFEAEEEKSQVETPTEVAAPAVEVPSSKEDETPPGDAAPATTGQVPEAKGTVPPAPPPETPFSVEKAPQSWRAPQREKWSKLDPDVRQEIMRRERETTKVLGETAQARQHQSQFNEIIAPFMARIQSFNVTPIVAVQELLKSDYILHTAPKQQRAEYMARLIKDYGIDILALDAALAGTAPADPVDAKVEQLLQQRLAPFQQYIQSQQAREQQAEQQSTAQINLTIEQMTGNEKFPHFETVRNDMADVIEISAKRGVFLSLEQAYDKAILLNPEVSSQVATQKAAEAKRTSAQTANVKAQKALSASVSVGGAPGGVPSGASGTQDRRSVIAAALDSVSGGR